MDKQIEVREAFSIQERDDDMLIAERHWQYGWRCIARRPKLLTNDEWRPDAERIVAALSTVNVDAETQAEIENAEKMRIVAWLRDQSDKGADLGLAAEKGSSKRAAFGGGSFALAKAADAIEADEHCGTIALATPAPVNVDALREARKGLSALLGHPQTPQSGACFDQAVASMNAIDSALSTKGPEA